MNNIIFKNKSGIYMIKNLVNKKVYIGRTKCFYRRYHQYKTSFKTKNNKHINNYLLNSMVKYGWDNFVFIVLELCKNEITPERELYFIKLFESTDKSKGYNLRTDTFGKMITHPDTSLKISKRLKKEWNNGARKDHGLKLKNSWIESKDRRVNQSNLFSKTLTKYKYFIDDKGPYLYKEMVSLGFKYCFEKFAKYGNEVQFKSHWIKRVNV